MYFPVSGWLTAFGLTLAVEVPLVLALLRQSEPDLFRLGLLAVFANLATHPLVWFVIPQLLDVGTAGYLLAAEGWAIAAEALFYAVAIRGLSWPRAAAVAIAANAASFTMGRVAWAIWPNLVS